VSVANAPVNVGDVLAGKYRVERLVGMGAMGVVVEARHLDLDQRVALKFLLAHRAGHEELHGRFLREARAAGCLRTPHVTRVSDVGRLDSGAPYMVMELLDGRDLEATLRERGRLPVAEAVEYILQTCEAVAEAHHNGIVHRDLKPANLFVTTNGDGSPHMKVLDFGVSKFLSDGSLKLTVDGQLLGSPLYMSPEQMLGKANVDSRSDIWALGAILYELVAGRSPFHAENMVVLQSNVLVQPPTPLATYVPDAPQAFNEIILQCLDKDPSRRWSDLATFAAALVPFAPRRAVPYAARVAAVLGVAVEPPRPTDALSLERAHAPRGTARALTAPVTSITGATSRASGVPPRFRKGPAVVALVVALAAVALAGVGTMRWHASANASSTSSGAPPESSAVPVEVAPTATASARPSSMPAEPSTVTPVRLRPQPLGAP
jgi:tRNA A-37 threonylcarbamoyl transferase component Bud32